MNSFIFYGSVRAKWRSSKFDVNWFLSCVWLESWFFNFISISEKKIIKWKFKEHIFSQVSHMKKLILSRKKMSSQETKCGEKHLQIFFFC